MIVHSSKRAGTGQPAANVALMQPFSLLLVVAAGVVVCLVVLLAVALCRISALSDERDARLLAAMRSGVDKEPPPADTEEEALAAHTPRRFDRTRERIALRRR